SAYRGSAVSPRCASPASGRTRLQLPAIALKAGSKLLRELDPVPVRVVDVEQAHLALELEDDPDLDPLRAQAVCLRFQVGHFDVGDCAVLLGLALAQADLHLAVPQMRP